MRPISALVVAAPTLLSLGLGSPLAAQQIVPLTDAPFSATLSVTENEGRTYREIFQRAQQDFIDRPDRDKPGGSHHHEVPLGVRQEHGLTLVGHRK